MAAGTIAAIAGIGGALIQGGAAKKAASTQAEAGQKQLNLQRNIYKQQKKAFAPFVGAGKTGLDAYQFELGLGERPEGYGGFQESEAFGNMLTAGRDTIEAGASQRGGLFSGSTGTALEKFRMGLASNEVNTYLNRLGALGQQGQAAAGMQAGAGTNFAQMGSQALGGIGDAQAAGHIGVGNAIMGGIDVGSGMYGMLSGLDTSSGNTGTMSDLFQSWNPTATLGGVGG